MNPYKCALVVSTARPHESYDLLRTLFERPVYWSISDQQIVGENFEMTG
jgi:hypothetical protein